MPSPMPRALPVLAALLAVSVVAAGPTSAGVRLPSIHVYPVAGKALAGNPLAQQGLPVIGGSDVGLPLQYGGGRVELTNTNYAIFWEPPGYRVSSTYNSLIRRYFSDIGGSRLFGTTTQYYQTDAAGNQQHVRNVSALGGSWVDTRPYPDKDLTDADIQAEVLHAMKANGWSGGYGREFFVYTALGAITITNFCAYHGIFTHAGTPIVYANEPYGGQSGCQTPSSPNHDPAADSAMDTTSHEQWESITDPGAGDGWVAVDGDEGSDQCAHTYGATDSQGADVVLHGHPYILQREWDNGNGLLLLGCTTG